MSDPSYLPILFDLSFKNKINAILPLQEDELILIAHHAQDFIDRGILPLISNIEVVKLCRDKFALYEKLKACDLPAVTTFLANDLELALDHYGADLILKPRFGAGSVGNMRGSNLDFIKSYIKQADRELIIQPYIKGDEYGINFYVDLISGKLVELFILKKIRMRAGETEKSISVKNERLVQLVKEICAILPFRGPIDLDVLEHNGEFLILEINPRFGGAYPHTHECGINFVKLLANNIVGKENKPFTMNYEEGVVAFRYMTITTINEKSLPREVVSLSK